MRLRTAALPVLGLALAFALALAPALTLLPGTARADGVADEAELHFQRGADAYRRADFLSALEHFLASNRLSPNVNVAFNVARTYEQLKRYPAAFRYYNEVLSAKPDAATSAAATEALARVGPEVAVVEVTSDPPGATVYLDRRDLGSIGLTPIRLGLAPGRREVLIELEGHEPARSGPLELTRGGLVTVALPLRRIVGTVEIAAPKGTLVRVGDEHAPVACTAPCRLELAPGRHELHISRADHSPLVRAVSVVAGEASFLSARLQPLTGSIVISSEEPNALIEIDGRSAGFAPSVVRDVPVGRRRIRISLRGFEPAERVVEVLANREVSLVDVPLVPRREVAAASRELEQIDDAPASVTVVTRAELEAFGLPTIAEALRGLRGVALTYDSIYANAAVRGIGQPNDYNNRLLVLSDGAVLNENVLGQPFIHYDGRVDLGDVERIELVRGPGSVLYGTGAVSGVVNIVTRPPEATTSTHAEVSTFGSTARGRVGASGPLPGGGGAWISLAGARSDGHAGRLVLDEDGDGVDEERRVDGVDAFDAATLAARAQRGVWSAQVFATRRDVSIPTGSFFTIVGRPENRYVDARYLAELRVEPRLGDRTRLLLRTHANHATFDLDYLFAAEGDAGPYEQPYTEEYTSTWAGAEARLVHDFARTVRVTTGVEAVRHLDVTMENQSGLEGGGFETGLDVSAPYSVGAGYGLVDLRPTRRVRLSAGLRLDAWRLEPRDDEGRTFLALSPRVTAVVQPWQGGVVKAIVGRAFRAPSVYELYYGDGGITQAPSACCGEELEPETVWSGELEASHRFGRDVLALLSLHGLLAEHTIESAPVPEAIRLAEGWEEGVFYTRNSGTTQRAAGLDAEIRRDLRAGWMVAAQAGVLLTRGADIGGTRAIPNAPIAGASLRSIFPLAPSGLTGALRFALEAPRRIDVLDDTTTDTAVIADAVISGAPGRGGMRWAVGAYNLFDWRAELPVTPFPSRTLPQPGRSFMFSLRLDR